MSPRGDFRGVKSSTENLTNNNSIEQLSPRGDFRGVKKSSTENLSRNNYIKQLSPLGFILMLETKASAKEC